ncbi:MAG: hypothetical protein KDA79_16240 [Planctomycetaceae bacterium]|nr:hypothetical protein [Planctomycetaceae bacterium]
MKDKSSLARCLLLCVATFFNAFLAGYLSAGDTEPFAVGVVMVGSFAFAGAAVVMYVRYALSGLAGGKYRDGNTPKEPDASQKQQN